MLLDVVERRQADVLMYDITAVSRHLGWMSLKKGNLGFAYVSSPSLQLSIMYNVIHKNDR